MRGKMPIVSFKAPALVLMCGLTLSACAISPLPLEPAQLEEISQNNLSRVAADQEPVGGAVSLYEAMARALKYNLDFKVEVMQQSLRGAELHLSHYNMLPSVVTNTGYASRNNELSTGELSLVNGNITEPRTTSTERQLQTSDIAFSWNILDFGLSYIRAHQAADRVLIAEEAKRRVVQRVIEDVRTAYWRAVSAERMVQKLAQLEGRTKKALASTRALYAGGDTSPITALTYERELVEIRRTAEELQRELSTAKTQLAALMNLPPETPFTLSAEELNAKAPALDIDPHERISAALFFRSEFKENAYQRRINEQEARAALVELLPGIDLYAGENYDSNKYLDNNSWVNWGAKASWNLVKVFQYPAKRDVVAAQDDLLDARALALTMAVMTQVHVSRIRYLHAARELALARDYYDVQQRLVKQMRAEAAAERISEQTLIREEMNALVSEAKRDIAFAAVQNAYANIFASVGLDPYASDVNFSGGVGELEAQLKGLWLERGDFGSHGRITLAAR